MHLTLTGNVHPLNAIVPEKGGAVAIAKIQATTYMVAFDSNLQRIYIILMEDPTAVERLETDGYWNSDIVLCSCPAIDGTDEEDARVLSITTDDSGFYIYALVFSRSSMEAYVKIFQLNTFNPQITLHSIRLSLPCDHTLVETSISATNEVAEISIDNRLGEVDPNEGFIPGAGMAWVSGRLYVYSRRGINILAKLHAFEYYLSRPVSVSGPDALWRLNQVGLEEEREARIYFYLLTVMDPYTGEVYGHYKMSDTSFDSDGTEYASYQGLTFADEHFFLGKHWDTATVSSDTSSWHLRRGKYVDTLPKNSKQEFLGTIKQEYCGAPHGQPIPALLPDLVGKSAGEVITALPELFRSTGTLDLYNLVAKVQALQMSAQFRTAQATQITETRGHAEIIKIPLSEFAGDKANPEYKTSLTQVTEYNKFPFDIAVPYSVTADRGNRKMYFAMGTNIWTFDMLGYTLISEYGSGQYLGDIIDFNEVKEGDVNDIEVYFRNDEPFTMYNVDLWLPYYENGSSRWADVFLLKEATDEGFKSVALGDIGPGESVSFIVRVYCLRVNDTETGKEHRLPLRVQWNWEE